MLNRLKGEANLSNTENGALTYISSGNECLDLFFKAGAMRSASEKAIQDAVLKAYIEDPEKHRKGETGFHIT